MNGILKYFTNRLTEPSTYLGIIAFGFARFGLDVTDEESAAIASVAAHAAASLLTFLPQDWLMFRFGKRRRHRK